MTILGSGNDVYGGIYQATASGAIADGKACMINADGTVSVGSAQAGKVIYQLQTQLMTRYSLENAYDPTLTTSGSYSAANTANSYKDSQSSELAANTTELQAISFNPDGTKAFFIDSNVTNSKIQEFTLSTAYDPSTLVYVDGHTIGNVSSARYPRGMDFKPDGTEVYVCSIAYSDIHQYTLSTAWDISTASSTRSFDTTRTNYNHGIRFKPDGTKMYTVGGASTESESDQYSLSTAWDISTASYESTLAHSSYNSLPEDNMFNNDGTKYYVLGSSVTEIITYSLTTAYDLSTASYVSETPLYLSAVKGFSFGPGAVSDAQYIGMSVGSVSDGATASIRVVGGLDTNQSGLTPNAACYVTLDGAVTSTNTGGAQIGWALTPTTVLIRGSYKNIL